MYTSANWSNHTMTLCFFESSMEATTKTHHIYNPPSYSLPGGFQLSVLLFLLLFQVLNFLCEPLQD